MHLFTISIFMILSTNQPKEVNDGCPHNNTFTMCECGGVSLSDVEAAI